MARLQLALDVTDLAAAVDFYTRLFGTGPARTRPGYANFAIEDPPLKLVLFEAEQGTALNHLGIEVDTAPEVAATEARLADEGLATTGVEDTTCCYATKTETWVHDPDGAAWEVYVRTGDAEQLERAGAADGACCAPAPVDVALGPA